METAQQLKNNLAGYAAFKEKNADKLQSLNSIQPEALDSFARQTALISEQLDKNAAITMPTEIQVAPNAEKLLHAGVRSLVKGLTDEDKADLFPPKQAQYLINEQYADAGIASYVAMKLLTSAQAKNSDKIERNVGKLVQAEVFLESVLLSTSQNPNYSRANADLHLRQDRLHALEEKLFPAYMDSDLIKREHIEAGKQIVLSLTKTDETKNKPSIYGSIFQVDNLLNQVEASTQDITNTDWVERAKGTSDSSGRQM